MKAIILASGSKGNATYIETATTKLMIDCGVSFKQVNDRLKTHTLELTNLDALLLTHEHSDHIKGLPMLCKKLKMPVYGAKATLNALKTNPKFGFSEPFESQNVYPLEPFMINDIIVTPIEASHDAVGALGYVIESSGKRLVYLTDTGFVPKEYYPHLENADFYIFEANYDVTLLFSSERPYYLKKRIDSVKGHLSNADSAYHLAQLIGPNTKTLVLAHPSDECNTESHVINTFKDVFASYDLDLFDYEFHVAKQHTPSKLFTIK